MKISTMFLRWLARNSDRLVQFITDLDMELDRLIAKMEQDCCSLEADIEVINRSAAETIAAVQDSADEEVAKVRAKMVENEKGSAVLKNIKNGLPTAS